MTQSEKVHPKAFISYSWDGLAAAKALAEKLLANGVDVVFDQYDVEGGQDLHAFMERLVTDKTITHALVLCSPEYTRKADSRESGTGVSKETLIISPKVYKDVHQTKFIPVLIERNSDGTESVPVYLTGRAYYDLSSEAKYPEEFQRLLRFLYNKPQYVKPPLRACPRFLDEVVPPQLSALESKAHIVASTTNTHARRASMADFRQEFVQTIKALPEQRTEQAKTTAELAWRFWAQMMAIRDVYLDLLPQLYRSEKKLGELLADFFEQLAWAFSGTSLLQDASQTLLWEMFLITIAYLRKQADYESISLLINHPYLEQLRNGEKINTDFACEFYHRSQFIEDQYRREAGKPPGYNLQAKELCENRLPDDIDIDSISISEADVFLHQVDTALSAKNQEGHGRYSAWFPVCYPYGRSDDLDEWKRLRSKTFCEKIAPVFGCKTVGEVKAMLKNIIPARRDAYSFINSILPSPRAISEIISPEHVGIDA